MTGISQVVTESRRRQGLPPKITDPSTYARLASLLRDPERVKGPTRRPTPSLDRSDTHPRQRRAVS